MCDDGSTTRSRHVAATGKRVTDVATRINFCCAGRWPTARIALRLLSWPLQHGGFAKPSLVWQQSPRVMAIIAHDGGWTDFLSKTSPEWATTVGTGKTVPWPIGTSANGNEGVAGIVVREASAAAVSVYVRSIAEALERYRKILGIEPAKVRHDYAKFELTDPPVIFSLNVGGEPGTVSHLGIRYPETGSVASGLVRAKNSELAPFQQEGTTCCYATADKFWVKDADGIPWEMYALLGDADAETAADAQLRTFLGQQSGESARQAEPSTGACCVPKQLTPLATTADEPQPVQAPAASEGGCCGPAPSA